MSVNVNGILAAQDGIITRRQAFAAGMSRSAISRRVTSEEWLREAPCIYRRRSSRLTPQAELRIAVYSAGDDAVAFGPSAAWWHGLGARPADNWVGIPVRSALEFRPRRRVRRRDLRSEDVTSIDGLRVTSVPMTVLDSAVVEGPELLHRALQSRQVSMRSLLDCHRRNASRSDAAGAGRLLADVAAGSHAAAVRRLIAILRDANFERWTAHVRIQGQRVDAAFPDHRIAIVAAGWADAGGPLRPLDGWRVVRFSWHELFVTPAQVVAFLTETIRCSAESVIDICR